MAYSGTFNKNTYETLNRFGFKMEPLQKRRRDIPELCNYLLKRISRQVHKEGLSLSESATKKLLAYDWPGNVAELENVLRGGAILSTGKTIEAEALFFPSRSPKDKPVYNLFKHSWLSNLFRGDIFPGLLGSIGLIAFIAILFSLFSYNQNNLLNSGLWSLGWFLIFFSVFFLGRIFCALCPFMIAGETAQRWKCFEIDRPSFISHKGEGLAILFIFAIFWMEVTFDFKENPTYTALLLISITLGAVIFSLLYQRRIWCRYLCPLGSLLGIFSLTSFFSLNADKHVCMYRCASHDCYIGKGDKPGCQLFLHPYGIESQHQCVLCMQCHKNCPYGAVKLNLQFPATGILSVAHPSLIIALASSALFGILPVESMGVFAPGSIFFNHLMKSSGMKIVPLFSILFLSAALLPSLIFLFIERYIGGYDFKKSVNRLTRFGYSLLPMALFGHIAFYGKKSVLWIEEILSETAKIPIDFFSANLLFYIIYLLIIFTGVAGTIHTFVRIRKSDPALLSTSKKTIFAYLGIIGIFTMLYSINILFR